MSPTPDPRAIRELAYRLWKERGMPQGSADSIWLEAECQLSKVHESFTHSAEPSLHASVSTQSAGSQGEDAEYSPEHPPVNAEFKWAAAELKSSSATSQQSQPATRPSTRR